MNFNDHLVYRRVCKWLSRETGRASNLDIPGLGALGTSIGLVRSENQDRAVVARFGGEKNEDSFLLLALCDGLGGMVEGSRCAEMALAVLITSLTESSPSAAGLRSALFSANQEIFASFQGNGGTTVALVLLPRTYMAMAATVGDSRIYVSGDASLRQLSIDDSIAGELNRLGVKREIDPNSDLFGGRLTQFLGVGHDLEPHFYPIAKNGGGRLLISSDGAHGVPSSVIQAMASNQVPDLSIVQRLISLANWTGGKDNATVICASLDNIFRSASTPTEPGLLELWDSGGKLELAVESRRPSSLVPVRETPRVPQHAQIPHEHSTQKPPRKKKQKTKAAERDESAPKPPLQIKIADAPSNRAGDSGEPLNRKSDGTNEG